MNIEAYLAWRQAFLKTPIGYKLQSTRGACTVGASFEIEDKTRPDWHLKNRELEDAEFHLMFYGIDQSPEMKQKLYANDEPLYQAYKSLKLHRLADARRTSRKNIIFNKECCLCYWQLYRDTLIVMSRSWDIQRAGLSDIVLINRIAHVLDCDRMRIITINNHVYDNREVIARRNNEASSI